MTTRDAQSRLADCEACGATECYCKGLCGRCYFAFWASHQAIPADVDEVAVLRAAQGERLRLNRGERIRTVGVLTKRGLSSRQIAAQLGVLQRVVVRDRQALRVNGLLPERVAS